MKLINKAESKQNKGISSVLMLLVSLVVLMVVFSCLSKYFFTFKNLMNLLMYSSVLGICACGFTLVVLAGSLDLSANTLSALAAVYAAKVIQVTDMWWLGIVVGVAIGVAGGCINGLLITRVGLNPLITTLGTMTIFKGLAYLVNNGVTIPVFNKSFKVLGQGYLFGSIPNIVLIWFAIVAIIYVMLKYTRFGREVYSVGGNSQASYLSGISVKGTRFKIYLTCSTLAGVSGVMYASLNGSGAPGANENIVLESMSSIILGGAALAGGRGTVIGTVLGVLVLGTITNGMTLLNISSFYQMIFKGLILLVAVGLDVFKGQGAYE